MRKVLFISFAAVIFLLPGLQNQSTIYAQDDQTVQGIVYHDKTGNGSFDPSGDEPLEGIAVSNGRNVAKTDSNGVYELPLIETSAIFVIKPRNWRLPVDENRIPRFYYMYSSEGASGEDFEGLAPTGALPESVNFPLYPAEEPDNFDVLVFGDTQPRDHKEIGYIEQDVLSEVTDTDAAFGVTLGDVVFNDLSLFDHLTSGISTIGIPWWYVPGNHDLDYSGNNNTNARGSWYKSFGPSYYSFSYGPAHFIVLDDIRMIVEEDERYYRTGLGEDQMEFLRNEIRRLDDDRLLVLLAHIPYEKSTEWKDEDEKKAFYELLASHPNSVSLAAHTHEHYHHFIGNEYGYPGNGPHHMISVGTVCGSWWSGAPDEFGIPHAMMSDGTPNGYAFLHIDGNDWKMSWNVAGKPADFQMHIDAPESVIADDTKTIKVTANIYNALPSADVKMRIGDDGEWVDMERSPQEDPARLEAMERADQLDELPWRKLGSAHISEHIWVGEQEITLEQGVHLIQVKAEDKWWNYEGKRPLFVK
ncbi:MAG: calcineurin-like phosphoesterase C-terminal domain-containing protein [Bacteroidales bacterium]|nr:calcineurin-like phosphoesterase C-terminal domain-containing protein [Bacteroidales bacterium]